MSEALTIENTKAQRLEFELTVQGVDATKEMKACLCIETDGMSLSFEAVKGESDTWSVELPVLPMLSRTTYDYKLIVVADGYHFEPAAGVVTVVGPRDIYTSAPKNVTLEPKKKVEAKDDEKKDKKESKPDEKAKDVKRLIPVVKASPAEEEEKVEATPAKKTTPKKVKFSKTDAAPKNVETSTQKKEKKKTAESVKPTFKSIITETFGAKPDDVVEEEAAPVSQKDADVKKLLAEVEQKNKDDVVRKAFEEVTRPREVVKVAAKGDRKIIEFVNAPTGKPRFKDVAAPLIESGPADFIRNEKDEEVLDILRTVKPDGVVKAPTIQFKKGKVVN